MLSDDGGEGIISSSSRTVRRSRSRLGRLPVVAGFRGSAAFRARVSAGDRLGARFGRTAALGALALGALALAAFAERFGTGRLAAFAVFFLAFFADFFAAVAAFIRLAGAFFAAFARFPRAPDAFAFAFFAISEPLRPRPRSGRRECNRTGRYLDRTS